MVYHGGSPYLKNPYRLAMQAIFQRGDRIPAVEVLPSPEAQFAEFFEAAKRNGAGFSTRPPREGENAKLADAVVVSDDDPGDGEFVEVEILLDDDEVPKKTSDSDGGINDDFSEDEWFD